MTTIDQLRDIIFYVLRKLNNIINEQPQPQPQPQNISIDETIERLRQDSDESTRQDEEYVIDLQKRIDEKRIILNYLLDQLIERREQKENSIIIHLLEEEFEKHRIDREKLEERLIKMKEHIRFMRN